MKSSPVVVSFILVQLAAQFCQILQASTLFMFCSVTHLDREGGVQRGGDRETLPVDDDEPHHVLAVLDPPQGLLHLRADHQPAAATPAAAGATPAQLGQPKFGAEICKKFSVRNIIFRSNPMLSTILNMKSKLHAN